MSSPRVVVVGDVMVDVTAALRSELAYGSDAPARIRIGWGGSGANTAAWLAAAGVPVVFVGRVGADDFGRAAVDDLTAHGVITHVGVDAARPTGTCIVIVHPDGERSMLPDAAANGGLRPEHLPVVAAGSHVHLSGYTLLNADSRDAGRAALTAARSRGASTSLDAASAAPLAQVGPAAFLEWTRGADLLFANADEAGALGGDPDPVAAARILTATYAHVVVKLGAAGALSCTADAEPVRMESAQAPLIVDTTGAGDAFAAGFLRTHLAGGDPAESLAAGTALAADAVSRLGARPP